MEPLIGQAGVRVPIDETMVISDMHHDPSSFQQVHVQCAQMRAIAPPVLFPKETTALVRALSRPGRARCSSLYRRCRS